MPGHWIDMVSMVYLFMGYLRGLKRGLGHELYKVINWIIPFLTGCGLYRWVSDWLGALPFLHAEHTGFIGFLLTMGITFALLRTGRKKLRTFLEERFSGARKRAGGLAGLLRTGVVVSSLAAVVSLVPVSLLGNSYLGKAVSIFLPDGEAESTAAEDPGYIIPNQGGNR